MLLKVLFLQSQREGLVRLRITLRRNFRVYLSRIKVMIIFFVLLKRIIVATYVASLLFVFFNFLFNVLKLWLFCFIALDSIFIIKISFIWILTLLLKFLFFLYLLVLSMLWTQLIFQAFYFIL